MSEPTMQEARRAVLQAIADNVNDIIATHGGTARAVVQTLDSETLDAYAAAVRRDTLAEVRAERNVNVLVETLHALGYPPIRHADARKVLSALTTMEDQ